MNLIDLCLCAAHGPIVGVARRWPNVTHAVTLIGVTADAKKWPNVHTVHAACGRRVGILSPIIWWAPRVKGTPNRRCADCEQLHGTRTRKPPKWTQVAT